MGQSYTVEAHLNFRFGDPQKFCDTIRDMAVEKDLMPLKRKAYNFDDPFECFSIVASDEAKLDKIEKQGEFTWSMDCHSDFDGTYSWEFVMLDILSEAFKTLDAGSVIHVYPDTEPFSFEVDKDGFVKYFVGGKHVKNF